MLHNEQDASDEREQAWDPVRNSKSDEKVQTENDEEECKKEMSHGSEELQVSLRSDL